MCAEGVTDVYAFSRGIMGKSKKLRGGAAKQQSNVFKVAMTSHGGAKHKNKTGTGTKLRKVWG